MNGTVIEDEADEVEVPKRRGRPPKNLTPAVVPPAAPPPKETSEPAKSTTLTRFVPSLTIKGRDGGSFKVPVNAEANRAAGQVLVSKVRSVLEARVDHLRQNPALASAKEIKDLSDAAEKLDKISQSAYAENGEVPAIGDMTGASAFGRMAGAMLKEAASGLAQGAANGIGDRMARMAELGKTKRATPVIDVGT